MYYVWALSEREFYVLETKKYKKCDSNDDNNDKKENNEMKTWIRNQSILMLELSWA